MLEAHHVLPVAWGGTDDDTNLVLLCPNHHAVADQLTAWKSGVLDGPITKEELLDQLRLIDSDEAAWHKQNERRIRNHQEDITCLLSDLLP